MTLFPVFVDKFLNCSLFRAPDQPPYQVTDGDIPCTVNKVRAAFFLRALFSFHFSSILYSFIDIYRLNRIILISSMFAVPSVTRFPTRVTVKRRMLVQFKSIDVEQSMLMMIGAILLVGMKRVPPSCLY